MGVHRARDSDTESLGDGQSEFNGDAEVVSPELRSRPCPSGQVSKISTTFHLFELSAVVMKSPQMFVRGACCAALHCPSRDRRGIPSAKRGAAKQPPTELRRSDQNLFSKTLKCARRGACKGTVKDDSRARETRALTPLETQNSSSKWLSTLAQFQETCCTWCVSDGLQQKKTGGIRGIVSKWPFHCRRVQGTNALHTHATILSVDGKRDPLWPRLTLADSFFPLWPRPALADLFWPRSH